MTSFQNLGLNPKILSALASKGYDTPTPIQLQAIPHLLEGKDILGIAQTGTGKTAAFSLPIIHNLANSNISVKSGSVRTLILTPTRELASQIADNIELYGKDLHLRHAVIFGGVSERPQIANLQRGVDILIATPGRLLDLATQGYIRFMQLEIFVLDEADRMLDMGFINDIKKIIARIPDKRQTLFFSATMPPAISDLASSILRDPVRVEVTPQSTTVERIAQKIMMVEKSNKSALLKRLVKEEEAGSVLVFCRTKHGSDRVEEFLERSGIKVAAIHGNKSQGAREKALDAFREGKVQVLIATDIAARGIDIPAISHVINYDLPMDPESYVHRIGRTARAGREGIAISFCDASELKLLQSVEKTINYQIPVDETHPFHNVAATPSSRESKRDDRDFDKSQGRRTHSHSMNRERGDSDRRRDGARTTRSENSGERRERPARSENGGERRERNDRSSFGGRNDQRDDRRRDGRSNDRRRGESSQQPDGKKTGLLDFIGLGKKKSEPRRGGARPRAHISKNGDFLSVNEKKDNKFGFSWFRNRKPDELNLSESREGTFGNRERSGSGNGQRRTDGRTGGRTDSRTGGRTDNRTGGRTGTRTDSRTGGRTGGRTDTRSGSRTGGRTDSRRSADGQRPSGNSNRNHSDNKDGNRW